MGSSTDWDPCLSPSEFSSSTVSLRMPGGTFHLKGRMEWSTSRYSLIQIEFAFGTLSKSAIVGIMG